MLIIAFHKHQTIIIEGSPDPPNLQSGGGGGHTCQTNPKLVGLVRVYCGHITLGGQCTNIYIASIDCLPLSIQKSMQQLIIHNS